MVAEQRWGTHDGVASTADPDLLDELTRLRRDLHAHPEIGLDLPRTQRALLDALDGLPLEITTGTGCTSVVAVLRGTAPGGGPRPVVLLRSDMDALPMPEDSGEAFASVVEGQSHSCGHDVHMAMLVGAARVLVERREELAGDVIFMFQPGEEGCNGAVTMLEEGVLDAAGRRPEAALALHVQSGRQPYGTFRTRRGAILSGDQAFAVTVTGRGGHGSAPHLATDPVPAIAEIITSMQTLVTRRFDAFDPVVVTVGSVHAGTKGSIIPERAELEATLRSYSARHEELALRAVPELVHGIAGVHGCQADIRYLDSVPVTLNDPAVVDEVSQLIADRFGAGAVHEMETPHSASEDFAFVLQQVPGAMVLLGACPPGVDPATAPENHSPQARFDDSVIGLGVEVFADWVGWRLRPATTSLDVKI